MNTETDLIFDACYQSNSFCLHLLPIPHNIPHLYRNLINGDYDTILDFQSDVNMTFSFRMKYSKKGSKVYKRAKSLKKKFEKDLLKLLDELENELTG